MQQSCNSDHNSALDHIRVARGHLHAAAMAIGLRLHLRFVDSVLSDAAMLVGGAYELMPTMPEPAEPDHRAAALALRACNESFCAAITAVPLKRDARQLAKLGRVIIQARASLSEVSGIDYWAVKS